MVMSEELGHPAKRGERAGASAVLAGDEKSAIKEKKTST